MLFLLDLVQWLWLLGVFVLKTLDLNFDFQHHRSQDCRVLLYDVVGDHVAGAAMAVGEEVQLVHRQIFS